MDGYKVQRTIGEGTFGIVYECRCKKSGKIVAVKCFKRLRNGKFSRRVMLRELRMLKLLVDQPNVVRLITHFYTEGQVCLVMEYASHNLHDVIRCCKRRVPLPRVKQLMFTLLIGMRSCHRNGIIHRDVKPSNVLVHHGTVSLLCDFGSSRFISHPRTTNNTTSGGLLRTPADCNGPLTENVATRWYRSPEMLLGLPHYTFASDMWAVGAIMAELASGEPLLPGNTQMDQLNFISQRVGDLEELGQYSKLSPFLGAVTGYRGNTSIAGDYLTRTFHSLLGATGLSLLRSLLAIDYSKRITVDEALAHPFFAACVVRGMPSPLKLCEVMLPQDTPQSRELESEIEDGSSDCDKWFGLGLGKRVHLMEIEPLSVSTPVLPEPVEVLLGGSLCRCSANSATRGRYTAGDDTGECRLCNSQGGSSTSCDLHSSKKSPITMCPSQVSSAATGSAHKSSTRFSASSRSNRIGSDVRVSPVKQVHCCETGFRRVSGSENAC
uniref:cyclin-dependent kinase n=1 Tax=Trypanosoma congolense (strain IL3000) TaxID=1068625 RepID=G0V195_TRYCI|nr:unnamed protein product [Trypanosoma congolense IL3000]